MRAALLLFFFLLIIRVEAQTVGWFYNYDGALPGYVLFAPNPSDTTYLIDKCGKKVHTWVSNYNPGLAVYLLEDGTLLRCGTTNNAHFDGGGSGGIVENLIGTAIYYGLIKFQAIVSVSIMMRFSFQMEM